jgi:hypothetical protein
MINWDVKACLEWCLDKTKKTGLAEKWILTVIIEDKSDKYFKDIALICQCFSYS